MANPYPPLTDTPALTPLLLRGAFLSPFKRPRPDAEFPRTRLVLPGVRVDLAKLAAYERVCGFATGDDALPITYPHVLGFPLAMRLMSCRAFPLPLLGLVHTSVEITRHTAVPATGEYEITVYVDELAPHRRGTEATVTTEMRVGGASEDGTGGEVVWESRSTYLARHHRADTPTPTPELPPARAPLPTVAEWRLGEDVGRRYGAASGDRNPIHLYPLTARLFGFPRAIAHGMWTAARCLAARGTPERTLVRAEFRAPVLLPGTVEYAALDDRFALRDGAGRVHVEGFVYPVVA
ncbi:MaoC/PaaZ C-terminal domain-containing protein [Streptomyces prunicolor]|jgi:acyl dehydratase|uniref:MaoC family dehydratase n=1 Tax=Streptomyces prunicolor TaxID=67348 RepID=UPI00225166B8|nr:MaoC/PaaZ C-terminal domain-containing protein [Streptomyces prunicolor]MCX5236539.1 MaoC/PaaZ C-terminal domain-containing protein [Streptomyces prunicolor]